MDIHKRTESAGLVVNMYRIVIKARDYPQISVAKIFKDRLLHNHKTDGNHNRIIGEEI